MELMKVPLASRVSAARNGQTCQPEYLPCLITLWAKMPIKAYFGSCTEEREQLYELLDLAPEENPSYEQVAQRIYHDPCCSCGTPESATSLLAVPMQVLEAYWKRKRGESA